MPDIILFTDICSPGFGRYAGTYRIASELRANGYKVQVIEYFTKWSTEELISIIKKFVGKNTLWVGLSTTFLEYDRMLQTGKNRTNIFTAQMTVTGRDDWQELVDEIRSINPDCKIVAGGHKANHIRPDDKSFDIIIKGQGEESVLQITKEIEEKRPSKRTLNLGYERFSTCSILWDDDDLIFPNEHLPIEIARGCIFKCSYCSYDLNGKKIWEFNRVPELVKKEIEDARNRFGSTGFMFCDDTYNDSPEKVSRFHEEFMKMDFNIEFSSFARLDLIVSHWETAKQLYESGLRSVFFGVESFNTASGKSIGKGMPGEKLKEGLMRLREECPEMIILTGLIVGLPHDTPDTLRANNEWLMQPDCPVDVVSYHPLYIHPHDGSLMSQNPGQYGYELDGQGGWKRNDGFTREEATALATELQLDFAKGEPLKRGAWTFFNRFQNLGFSAEQFKKTSLGYPNDVLDTEIIRREQEKFDFYKSRLLSL